MRHHRRIEQGRGFQRIFLREKGAQQQLPRLAQALVGDEVVAQLLEALQEKRPQPLVPVGKFAQHGLRPPFRFQFRERHHASDDFQHPLAVGELEGAKKDPRVVRFKNDGRASDSHNPSTFILEINSMPVLEASRVHARRPPGPRILQLL